MLPLIKHAGAMELRERYANAVRTRAWFADVIVAVEALQLGVYVVRGTQMLAVRSEPSDSPDLRLLGTEEAVAALQELQAKVMAVWN